METEKKTPKQVSMLLDKLEMTFEDIVAGPWYMQSCSLIWSPTQSHWEP